MRNTYMEKHMYNRLKPHWGHHIECVYYGDPEDPVDICIECCDCNEVLISAEVYDLYDSEVDI